MSGIGKKVRRIRRDAKAAKLYVIRCVRSEHAEWDGSFIQENASGRGVKLTPGQSVWLFRATTKGRATRYGLAEARRKAQEWSYPNLGVMKAVRA